MNAFEIPAFRYSLPAGGAVGWHRFVSVASDAAIQATDSTAVVGVAMNEVTSTEYSSDARIVEIATGIVLVEAGAAITSGAAVASDANGKAITFVSGTTGAACGVAITAATAADELVAVKVD